MPTFAGRLTVATSVMLALLLIATAAKIQAQAVSIAFATGRVTNRSGAVADGAQVKITVLSNNSAHSAVTGTDVFYSFPSLPIGVYTPEVAAQEFETYSPKGMGLQMNQADQSNVRLKVGAVSDKIEVEADVNMVQPQRIAISQVVDQARIIELLLNGRDQTQLISISGTAIDHVDGTNTSNRNFYTSHSIAVFGSAGNTTNYLLDGGDNDHSFMTVNMGFPFPDALAEFTVETSVLRARNSLDPGGLVNAVTRSGSNQWHGDAFEFVRKGSVTDGNFFAAGQDGCRKTLQL